MSTILSWYSKVPFNIPRLFHVLFERLIPIQLHVRNKQIVDKEIPIQLLSISYFFSYRNASSWCTSQSALTRRPTTVTRRDSPEAWWPRARLGHRDQRGDHWRMMVNVSGNHGHLRPNWLMILEVKVFVCELHWIKFTIILMDEGFLCKIWWRFFQYLVVKYQSIRGDVFFF